MENQIFRKKSIDRLSSPEQMTDYMRVTSPSYFVLGIGLLILLVSFFLWSSFATAQSYFPGKAQVKDQFLTITFQDKNLAQRVEPGMVVIIEGVRASISSVGTQENGTIFATATANIPDGEYDCQVGYRHDSIVRMLL